MGLCSISRNSRSLLPLLDLFLVQPVQIANEMVENLSLKEDEAAFIAKMIQEHVASRQLPSPAAAEAEVDAGQLPPPAVAEADAPGGNTLRPTLLPAVPEAEAAAASRQLPSPVAKAEVDAAGADAGAADPEAAIGPKM